MAVNWHFPREELANKHLAALFDQGISRLAFFGRRRIGKTEYIQQDLAPAATRKGILPLVYVSLWENKDRPHLTLMQALHDTTSNTWKTRFKVDLALPPFTLSAEAERAERPVVATDEDLRQLSAVFNAWLAQVGNKPALIVLDEIQHLATSNRFLHFAANLRSLLDRAPGNVKVIFTGSSMADLKRLFQSSKAPFFGFTSVMDFPVLDKSFTNFLADIHQQISGQTIDRDLLYTIFFETGYNAQVVRGLVERLILDGSADLELVWQKFREDFTGDDGWCSQQWQALRRAEKVAYLRLLEGKDPFSAESIAVYDTLGFSKSMVQKGLLELENRSLISRVSHGVYALDVPILSTWLQSQNMTSHSI